MDNILGCTSDRRSTAIRIRPSRNLYHAPRIAEEIGYPLNEFTTINFEQMGCPESTISRLLAQLRSNYLNKFLTRPPRGFGHLAVPPTYFWSLENEGNHVGVHAHIMAHIPPERRREYLPELPRWVEAVTGLKAGPGIIHTEPANPARPWTMPKDRARYLLKAAPPIVAENFGAKARSQGETSGKRSGTSVNLGCAAKERLRAEGRYPRSYRRPFTSPGTQSAPPAAL